VMQLPSGAQANKVVKFRTIEADKITDIVSF